MKKNNMISLLSIVLFLSPTHAATDCSKNSQKIENIKEVCAKLEPACIKVTDLFKGTKKPEEVIKKLTEKLSDEELFTRLIFAEGLASKCVPGENSDYIFQGIAWTLANRVSANQPKKFGSKRDVALHSQQFRSSIGGCDVATRTELLCPQSIGPQWYQIWEKAQKAYSNTKTKNNQLSGVHNYFFPKHFDNSKDCVK